MKKIINFVLAILLFSVGKVAVQESIKAYKDSVFAEEFKKMEKQIDDSIIENVKLINRQTPIMIDEETRLDASAYGKNILIHKYTLINCQKEDFVGEELFDLEQEIKQNIITNLKNEQFIKKFKQMKEILKQKKYGIVQA